MTAGAARAKKITFDMPQSLYERAERVVHERHTSTSEFIREAVEQYLEGIQQKNLEAELAEGYVAHAALSAEVHKDFEFVDAEQD